MSERKFVPSVDWNVTVHPAPEDSPEMSQEEFNKQYEQKFVCNPENKEDNNG